MIIRGGRIFILDGDVLPKVTITDATIIMECADPSLDGLKEFICARIGRGSEVNACTFVPMSHWAEQRTKEGIDNAKSDLHLRQAPVMQRIRKFIGLEAS